MALFKPFMGSRADLDAVEKVAGHAYFCTDDGSFHIDYVDADGNLQRKQISDTELAAEVLKYTEQTLTDEQKAQARTNIGAGRPIIDVFDELPTDNIDAGAFYRLTYANWVRNHNIQTFNTCYCVNVLPASGVPAMDLATEALSVYYNTSNGIVYAYIDNGLSSFIANTFPDVGHIGEGWYPFENFTGLLGMNYGGVITSMNDAEYGVDYILISYALYSYNNQWEPVQKEQEVIQSNWLQNDPAQPDYIQNRPFYTEDGYVNKISPEYLYQPDWNVSDESNPNVIKNRPFGDIAPGSIIYSGYANVVINDYGGVSVSEGSCTPTFEVIDGVQYEVISNGVSCGTVWASNDRLDFGGASYIVPSTGQIVNVCGSGPIQVKCLSYTTKKLNAKYLPFTVDASVRAGSTNPVSSDAVYTKIDVVHNTLSTHNSDITKLQKSSTQLSDTVDAISDKVVALEDTAPPEVAENDENKVLKVIDGVPQWSSHKASIVAVGTITIPSVEDNYGNHIIKVSDMDIDTQLSISSTSTKAFCAGKNWFSLDNMTYVKGNYAPGDNPNSFTITNNYVELSFNTPLPIGWYRVSSKATLHDTTSLPMLRFFDSNNVSISQTSETGTNTSYSPQFVYRTDYDRYGVVFYASAPIAKMTVYAGHGNVPGANSSFTEFAISPADDTDWSYPGDYNGSIYDITQDAQIIISSDPMYIFADDFAEFSVGYKEATEVELPPITLNDNGKILKVVDGLPKWEPEIKNTTTELEPYTLTGSMVTLTDEESIGLPLKIEAVDTATKVHIHDGKNWFPNVDGNGNSLFNDNGELIVDATTKANAYYRVIDLGMMYPPGSYRFGAEVSTAYNENHASYGTDVGNVNCTIRFYKDSTLVYYGELKVNRGTQQDVSMSANPSGSEKQPFNKIYIYSGSGNTGAKDVDAVFKNIRLTYNNESALTYEPYTGTIHQLPAEELTVDAVPLYMFTNDQTELCATYHHSVTVEETVTGLLPTITKNDNGKVLKVVEGVASWSEVQTTDDTGDEIGLPPDYYFENNYLTNKVNTINNLIKATALNGDAFIFITDQHLEGSPSRNAGNGPALLKYIRDNTKVRKLFSGGDVCLVANRLEPYVDKLETIFGDDAHYAIGNHEYDTYTDTNGVVQKRMTEADLFYLYDINKSNQIGNSERHYYYVDNPQQKIRYVVLNNWMHNPDTEAHHDGTKADDLDIQAEWLTNTAFNVEEGWGILLFCHQFFNDAGATAPSGTATAYQTAIDSYTGNGEIIAVFHGHIHKDMVNHTVSGVPAIGVTSDKYYSTTTGEYLVDRTLGTITEQAFDVVIVDRTARKLHCVRVGGLAIDGNGAAGNEEVEIRVVDFRPQA